MDTKEWITEAEAQYNCPNKLAAFKKRDDQFCVNDDPPGEMSNKKKQLPKKKENGSASRMKAADEDYELGGL